MKNKIRVTFQLLIISLIAFFGIRPFLDSGSSVDFEAYCPMGGISSFMSKLNLGTMSCSMSEVQVMMGMALIIGAVLFGKLFCSYVCPIGTFAEWLGRLGAKFGIKKDIPTYLDKPLRTFKYILLFITVYFTMTASELFCKEYDPYFAIVNMFGDRDINLVYAIMAVTILIGGAIFLRLFWCKYLCPLGAAGNLFYNSLAVGSVIVIYILLNVMGLELGMVWLLAAICLTGWITEVFFKKSFVLPFTRITRNTDTCTDCGRCEKACPMNIKIMEYETVTDIDCHLCSDCVNACKVKNTLTINKKPSLKYLAPVMTVVLFLLALGFSTQYEFQTISERWGNFEKLDSLDQVAVFRYENLKTVKCFGSALALKGQLSNVKGIVGVDAYAASHTVEIFYNKNILNDVDVKRSIFEPTKQKIQVIKDDLGLDSLSVIEAGIFGLFDKMDYMNMFYALRVDGNVYGFETMFGEPTVTIIYYDESKTDADAIKKCIEAQYIVKKVKNGEKEEEIDFIVDYLKHENKRVGIVDFSRRMFKDFDQTLGRYKEVEENKMSVFKYPAPEMDNFFVRQSMPKVVSHLSKNKGILRARSYFTDQPYLAVYYTPELTTPEEIISFLTSEKLQVSYRSGEVKEVNNVLETKPNGQVMSFDEFKEIAP